MDYTWGVPIQQAIMQQYGYGNYHQYPQHLNGYEPYYMGHPWTAGSYAPMYPYGMGGYQQMTYPSEDLVDVPPAAKKARLEYPKEDNSYHNENENSTSEILNADQSTVVPDSFELQIDTNPLEYTKDNSSSVGSKIFRQDQSDIEYPHDATGKGPLTSTLAAPLPSAPILSPPASPIRDDDVSLTQNDQTFDLDNQQQYDIQQGSQELLTSGTSSSTQQIGQEQPISTAPFDASQVMVVLPDGSKSSIWDLQVPAAFASYQQPAPYYPNVSAAPGPSRKRRSSGPRVKNNYCHLCEKSYESSYKLKLHMNAHTGERPFVCEFCGKGFARGPNLNAHRRVHTGEKPFNCNRCSRGFSHPSDRIVHMVTEVCLRADRYIRRTGQGWECNSCDSGVFESREQADRHARQHETGKGLACPVCQNNFQGQKAHVLVKHVRECHPEYMASIGL